MKEPERLEHAGRPVVRALMRAGRNESPPSAVFERTLGALGVAGPAASLLAASLAAQTASAASVGAVSTAMASGVGVVAKWVGVGMVAGLVVSGTAVSVGQVSERNDAPSRAAPARPEIKARPAEQLRALSQPTADPGPSPAASRAPGEAPRAVRAYPLLAEEETSSKLGREVRDLDGARLALRRGDVQGALSALDRYDSGPRQGDLGSEAMYLRMEAWLRAEDHERAANAARRLLSAYPQGPHSARARAVLGL